MSSKSTRPKSRKRIARAAGLASQAKRRRLAVECIEEGSGQSASSRKLSLGFGASSAGAGPSYKPLWDHSNGYRLV